MRDVTMTRDNDSKDIGRPQGGQKESDTMTMTLESLSYSQINSIATCGEQYRLTRIVGLTEGPSAWLIGGSAVHRATETIDKLDQEVGKVLDHDYETEFYASWMHEYTDAIEPFVPFTPPLREARGQGADWWQKNGPGMVKNWHEWFTTSGLTNWIGDDGIPGIEVPVEGVIGGVRVRGFIDRVVVDPTDAIGVIDLKSGSRAPASQLQLGIYAELLEQSYGVRPAWGGYYMVRKPDGFDGPHELDIYTEAMLEGFVVPTAKAKEHGIYLASPGWLCGSCGVKDKCFAVGSVPTPYTLGTSSQEEQS